LGVGQRGGVFSLDKAVLALYVLYHDQLIRMTCRDDT